MTAYDAMSANQSVHKQTFPKHANVQRHHAKFRQDRSSRYGDIAISPFLQDGGRPPSWICWTRIRTTHEQYSTVFTAVQSLVAIHAVVAIIWRF